MTPSAHMDAMTDPTAEAVDLRTDDDSGLVATGSGRPALAWRLVSARPAAHQRGFEVRTASDADFTGPLGTTGVVRSGRTEVALPGPALRSREVRWWRVRVLTDRGWTAWSGPSRVEAALLERSDWVARPVTPAAGRDGTGPGPAPVFREEFSPPDGIGIRSARLYVSALGVHDTRINGRPVSGDLLEGAAAVRHQSFGDFGLEPGRLRGSPDFRSQATRGPRGHALRNDEPTESRQDMRWSVHGERTLHDTPWVRLRSLEVEQPDGARADYHVVRLRDIAVTAAVDDRQRVLMMWRHRFVTDTWGWELPMGLVEDGESPAAAAARELEEETGWRPGSMRELIYAQPAAGITDSQHFVFRTDDARHVGEPTEHNESDRLEWIPLTDLPGLITRREIVSSATLVGVMALLLGIGA